ncbi:MAG: ATP-dependent metallopeptidase FtsH/Yme1/Tma family protein [Treponema sp.]|nr:ATP-dependent metallopeptidase FtsH/Yme1/Tma family protein [Treponema sp.]MEE3434278.1 ATP-dependent metallopeptidase FtsH/Yme1/Tma family protein [Treponema sp.]
MKLKAKFIIPLAILLAGGIFFYDYYSSAKIQEVPYADFYAQVEGGTVASAKIAEDEIIFVDAAGQELKTQNPDSPTLKEFLLRSGVSVKSEKSAAALVSLALDIFFYGFFFFIIFAAFSKFISPNSFKVVRKTGVKFLDVVGMEDLKRDMAQVMQIMKNPREWEKRGVRLPKGILLEGEPGNGKTLFAKALAGEASVNFIPAKATDFESMFMAIGPLKVKLLFAKARRRAPCIVFIDEFDGIGTRRNYSGSAIETENTRIVTALLNELDGFEPTKGVLVVAATNSVQALDPALIRPGRFDARFKVPYPDMSARVSLVQKYTQAKKRAASCSDQKLAQLFEGFSCAKIESVLNKAALLASQAGRSEFTLDDVEAAAARVD